MKTMEELKREKEEYVKFMYNEKNRMLMFRVKH